MAVVMKAGYGLSYYCAAVAMVMAAAAAIIAQNPHGSGLSFCFAAVETATTR